MAQDVIYPGEGSMSTWKKGEIHCFGVKCPIQHPFMIKTLQKAGEAILISDKIDFKTKAVKRDKEGYYIMIKGSIQEEDITIINIYAPNIGAPQ